MMDVCYYSTVLQSVTYMCAANQCSVSYKVLAQKNPFTLGVVGVIIVTGHDLQETCSSPHRRRMFTGTTNVLWQHLYTGYNCNWA